MILSGLYSTAFLDPEWFTFETAGTMVVGMDGGQPRRSKTNAGNRQSPAKGTQSVISVVRERKKSERVCTRASGIERAAAAATGTHQIRAFLEFSNKSNT